MQHEEKKISLIVNEVVTLLLQKCTGNIEVKINRDKLFTQIIITQKVCEYDERFIQNIRHSLTVQRQSEIEGYYWQLVGDDEDGEELALVGAMSDEATVELDNDVLRISIIRKKR